MKRLLTATIVATLALAGTVSTAAAANQPSQGEHSIGRNDNGSAGPHCHVLVANHAGPFSIQVFPSHKGHAHAGNDIFNADLDCDGDAP
ncbi:MAG: hypothetical protein ACRDYW_05145 [Acidimicrobiales bacterium]